MILVDTTIWIDHFRRGDRTLARLLDEGSVSIHACVLGELALGHLPQRTRLLNELGRLPRVNRATDEEVAALIESERLYGLGIGFGDAHLLAATRLTPETTLWTRDRLLRDVAETLGVASAL